MSDDQGDDYVGYKHPPAAHRFKKGEPSPNPRGRPRKPKTKPSSDLLAIIFTEAQREIEVIEGGRQHKTTMTRVLVRKMMAAAAAGDARRQRMFLELLRDAEHDHTVKMERERKAAPISASCSPQDAAKAYFEMINSAREPPKPPSPRKRLAC